MLGLINYIAALFLVLFGLFSIIQEKNYFRKVIGMVLLQTGVILFWVSLAYKENSLLPILKPYKDDAIDLAAYSNPLPHALMLTAIVVGVSTLGVALVLLVSIYQSHKSLEEDEILEKVRKH